jgi:prepilin-type N-terminal cleavage/methylation domain-containing protein
VKNNQLKRFSWDFVLFKSLTPNYKEIIMQYFKSKNPVNYAVCETIDHEEILNQVQNDNYEEFDRSNSCKVVDMKKTKTSHKKAAFTLAEVLIAIGIIGVVAAMTIPNLVTNYQKQQTATRLKDTYAILTNAIRLAEKDYDSISGWELNQADVMTDVKKYLLPYMKATTRTANEIRYQYKHLSGAYPYDLAIFNSSGTITVITLLNGVELITAPFDFNGTNALRFIIDINGYNNGPNKFGRDAFYIYIVPEVGIAFHRKNNKESWSTVKTRQQLINGPSEASYECNKKAHGLWCGELIRRDGWKISKDYPW